MVSSVPSSSAAEAQLNLTAPLVEVFSAIQGEGLNVGTRQIFIRFAQCDLRCHFCDSAHTWYSRPTCQIERSPGQRDFQTYPNPVTIDQLLTWVKDLHLSHLHDSISLTGGEPLLQSHFLQSLLPQLRETIGLPLYLETGGHRPQELQQVLAWLDLVGMDIKLPSASGENYWTAHAEFLRCCHTAGVEVFCKLILSQQTTAEELEQTTELIASIDPAIPLILQPVTPLGNKPQIQAPTPAQVLHWQALCKTRLKQVRVIPQTHKMIGQR